MLRVLQTLFSKKSFPTGNPDFSVQQAFPGSFKSELDTDPFLMCDYFGPKESEGIITDPDKFVVPWHPHRGMDICTYMTEGNGRHADSLGNRETFSSPGMQWISVGSGIEHAESGGTPKGQNESGFQIWINVPKNKKMLDPRYGTHGPSSLPLLNGQGYSGRLLAGHIGDQKGPFETATAIEMIDIVIEPNAKFSHNLDSIYDQSIVYVYKGSGLINTSPANHLSVIQLDARTEGEGRGIELHAGELGFSCMLFSGKRINQPIAWRGPFVMNTQEEIQQVMNEIRSGNFPPKRVDYDYKKLSTFPKDHTCKTIN